jgi:hypothetical protein
LWRGRGGTGQTVIVARGISLEEKEEKKKKQGKFVPRVFRARTSKNGTKKTRWTIKNYVPELY